MNDRYLFRGKRIDNGEWVVGYYVYDPQEEHSHQINMISTHPCGHHLLVYSVISKTVGQCTGLKDKNGKPIFEGDICEYHNSTGVIEFDNGDAMFAFTYDKNIQTNFSCIWGKDLEILGNIYDNSELLEVD